MTRREKILCGATGALVVVGLGFVLVKNAYLGRLASYEAERDRLGKEYDDLQLKNAQIANRAHLFRSWAARTYDLDELRASAKLAATLIELVERAGLNPERLSVQPVHGSQVKGVYRELGRAIRVRGGLKNIVDFLYLLETEPHLHRLDQVSITPVPKNNEVDLQVRYVTPVIDAKPEEKLVTDKLPTTVPVRLDTATRGLYKPIAARDLLRPYLQRIPTPPPPTPVASVSPRESRTPPERVPVSASPSRFRIVGLPDWTDQQEVLVTDSATRQIRSYKAGDTLGGGVIACVDYRPMPSKANPTLLSPSRVILKVGPDYFAVELGENLTDKRRLSNKALPEHLRPASPIAPANSVKKIDPIER